MGDEPQEPIPLAAISRFVRLGYVTPRGVKNDGGVRDPPIAILRPRAVPWGNQGREQAGSLDSAGFSRAFAANQQIPGKHIARFVFAFQLWQALQGMNRFDKPGLKLLWALLSCRDIGRGAAPQKMTFA